ncbi:MAG: hypothetical protein BWY31_04211 [Lentisphaerae bacterium ADurb.Bin242]|nr:MAG: hypothetical protein BWY31_04211 [Lentisphaerae bacterium ADurb.Bin242]
MSGKIFYILLCCAFAFSMHAAQILNGSFELPEKSRKSQGVVLRLAENWDFILQAGSDKTGAEMTDDAHSGKKAARLFTKVEKAFVGAYQTLDCEPDTTLTAYAWMKGGKQGCKAYFRIFFIDKNGQKDKKYLMPGWNVKDSWTLCEYKFQIPPHASKIYFGIETLGNRIPDAELIVDDVMMQEESAPVLANGLVRAEIDPLFGGCIRSLETLVNGKKIQWTLPRSMNATGGLALEIIPMQRVPGAFANKKYELSVLEPKRKILVSHLETDGKLAGLQVNKIFTLDKDSLKINVDLEFVNTGAETISTSCRIQNILVGSDGFFTSPTRDWLQAFHKTAESTKTTNALNSNNLQSGWLAKTTPDAAAVFAFHLPHVTSAYSWISEPIDTVEWYYSDLKLTPKESWKTSYSINTAPSGNPVFAFDGKAVWGVDSLDLNAAKTFTVAAVENISQKYTVNSKDTALKLKAGETATTALDSPAVHCSSENYSAVYGAKYNYKTEFIKGIKLPAPKKISLTPRFDHFFPFMFNDVALAWRESTGVSGAANQFIRNAESAMRECAANHFNLIMMGRIIQKTILSKANLEDGRNLFGELAVKYDLSLVSSTLLFGKNDINVEKFRPILRERLDFFYHPDHLNFIKKYDRQYKAIFTADETTGQNIPCMLEAHEALAKRIPVELPIYPYLNIHTRVYIPYAPVFFGDWYPVNRKSYGGRNPWSVERVVAETVAQAKEVPVHIILQCFGSFQKGYAFPTPAEYRMMCHLACANGVKGIDSHEVNNRGLSWRYNYGYHYAARGNAGELTPLWFALGECAREITAIGPQLIPASPCAVPAWLKLESPRYRSANGYYDGPQVKFYTLDRKDGVLFAVAVNHSEKNAASLPVTFAPPNRESIYSLTKMAPADGRYRIELKPGDAEYFVIGKESEVRSAANEVALERFNRAKVVFRIAADRAAGNGVDMTPAFQLENEAVAAAAKKNGQEARKKIAEAGTVMNELIAASDYGRFNAEWNKVRTALSDVSFLFLTHFDLVIPPHLRAKTARYAKWNNTDDPKMQKLVDDVADCWTEYWQIENQIVNGKLSSERTKADLLMKKAFAASKAATEYLKANAHKIVVDDPYAE